jgi:hypothetical protein
MKRASEHNDAVAENGRRNVVGEWWIARCGEIPIQQCPGINGQTYETIIRGANPRPHQDYYHRAAKKECHMERKIVNICPNCGLGHLAETFEVGKCAECGSETINIGYNSIKERVVDDNGVVQSVKRIECLERGEKPYKLHYPKSLKQ